MSKIVAQLNPTAMIAVLVLILLSVAAVLLLRLIRNGRAKTPGDLVKIAREKAAASKETKAATKRAEAAIAEPMTNSRLSRISAKGMAEASAARAESADAVDDEPQYVDDAAMPDNREAPDFAEADADETYGDAGWNDPTDEADSNEGADWVETEGEASSIQPMIAQVMGPIDLADPDKHPADWDGLLAIIGRLDGILAQSWHGDELAGSVQVRLAAARAAAGELADEDPMVRALARDAAAIDLARTINNAAREQAAEVVEAVREFAHQQAFSPQDCAAVMHALQQIEWMALIARDDKLEKRTLPLTVHDPEAPLWVAEAWEDLRATEDRAAA